MVAAPETQTAAAQAANAVHSPSIGKLVNGANKGEAGNEQHQGAQEQAGAQAALAENGANDLTVVDSSAQESSKRSHMSNFDPTPAATTNLPPPDISRHIPCRFFPLGTCRYGDKCAFSHGVAGVAGSPGVPSTAELGPAPGQEQSQQSQQQQPNQQQQQEQYMHQPESYGQGMPMYYPGMEHGAVEYGYSAPFSPQQGYYPFPPHFQHQHYQQHYQQGPPPQAYYQQGPPPPQHAPQLVAESAAPAASPSPVPSDSNAQPNSPEVQRALSPSTSVAPPFASPSAPQQLPLQGYPAPYAAYPGQAEYGFAPQAVPTSPTAAFGPDGAPLPAAQRAPSLHTFFQTGAPASSTNASAQQQQSVNGGFPKGAARPPAAARRQGPPMGMPFRNGLKPRYAPGTPKPACSFFESNRCKNRDSCPFQHLLPDGTDARHLLQNMAGVDGRTDNLEERGGLPPAWLANPRKNFKAHQQHQHQHPQGQQNFNGGYSVREPRPRNRFEEEQQRQRFEAQGQQQQQQQQQHQAQQPAAVTEGGEPVAGGEGEASAAAAPRAQSETRQSFPGQMNGRLPPGGAPQLVAAINGLTRGIRPASQSPNGATPSTPSSAPQQPQQPQRVPSGADFPALSSAPLSPSLDASSPSPSTEPTPVVVESAPEVTPTAAPSTSTEVPAPSPALAASESSESEFVMVSHSDATPPAPAARIMGSFASAAARGASVVLPEKPKRVSVAPPAKAAVAEETNKEAAAPVKKEKKAASSGAAKQRAPVAVKAAA